MLLETWSRRATGKNSRKTPLRERVSLLPPRGFEADQIFRSKWLWNAVLDAVSGIPVLSLTDWMPLETGVNWGATGAHRPVSGGR